MSWHSTCRVDCAVLVTQRPGAMAHTAGLSLYVYIQAEAGRCCDSSFIQYPRTDEERQAKINTICNVTQRFCTGTLQQYSSFNDCQQFLRTQIPYGSYGRADQGNVICRFVHTYFVPVLPSIHCPHVGPTGGGACTDKTIDFYYNQTNFLACAHKQ
ncbi:unnamed protein product [Rotaria sp. Silwood1]|nr:unnamed protein product [Rotaria sp. Silwood1]CAF1265243.1 unnamed protein product [Rotaria sp. Silwood1]